jgi:hypothetical protein
VVYPRRLEPFDTQIVCYMCKVTLRAGHHLIQCNKPFPIPHTNVLLTYILSNADSMSICINYTQAETDAFSPTALKRK